MIVYFFVWLATLLTLIVNGSGYAISFGDTQNNHTSDNTSPSLRRRAADPADFSWIKRWACVGDSFSAGIGSGDVYSNRRADVACSRYDYSYPAIMNRKFGPSVQTFEYWACSGDKSVDIHNQVVGMSVYNQLNTWVGSNLDFVTLTAGGNDLCLSDMIKTCIVFPRFWGSESEQEDECNALIAKAQFNMDTFLGENIKSVLRALNDKMNTGGLIVYNLYGEFFSEETEECATDQDWAFTKLLAKFSLKLTVARRKRFNELVRSTNAVIRKAVDEISKDPSIRYKIETSDWGDWPKDGVVGLMCEPGATGHYPDEVTPDLQFFKPRTSKYFGHTELKRSMTPEHEENILKQHKRVEQMLYKAWDESILYRSPDPRAVAKSLLDPRAPVPPGCPGDGGSIIGGHVPDKMGRYFHPNEKGHETIASFALATLIGMRADQLGVPNPFCSAKKDEFRCWSKEGRKAYTNSDQLHKSVTKFCDSVTPPNGAGWRWEVKYLKGTPDEHTMVLQLSSQASIFDKNQCLESLQQLIDGCDGNNPNNPLNWKLGGRKVIGEYTYEVNPERTNRPFPPISKTDGYCDGRYRFYFSSYTIRGSGWSTWDYGQDTLLPKIKACLGLGVTAWNFNYFDAPDGEGNEWEATFNTPVFVNARCFQNNKVAFGAGGFTHGCHGNDP